MNLPLKKNEAPDRLIYLDWLKVLAVSFVFIIHSVRFFDFFEWYVKNDETSLFFSLCSATFVIWIMPLFFFISGASMYYSANARSVREIIGNRCKRLLPPLVVGIFILSPHQVYFERITNHQFSGSFTEFMPHYFEGWYGFGGNFAWPGLHLWYLLFLFVFTLLALPVISFLQSRRSKQNSFTEKLLTGKWAILSFIIISCIPMVVIPPNTFVGMPAWGTWNMLNHFITFLLGYYCYSKKDFATGIKLNIVVLVALALLFSAMAIKMPFKVAFGSPLHYLNVLLRSTACWLWVFAVLKIVRRYFNFSDNALRYASDAAMPVYVLHQPVLVLVGYFIVPLEWNMFAKYIGIASISFTAMMLFYHFMIRRINVLRVLMGLPLKKKVSGETSASI